MEATVPTPGIDDSIPSPAARPAPTRSPVANLPTASAPDMIAPRPGILFATNLPPTLAIPFVAAFLPTVFMIFFCAVLVCVASLLAMSFLTFFTAGVFADPAFGNNFLFLTPVTSPVMFGFVPVRLTVLVPVFGPGPKNKIESNVTADPSQEPNLIKNLLIEQIEKPVRWRESVLNMINNGNQKFI